MTLLWTPLRSKDDILIYGLLEDHLRMQTWRDFGELEPEDQELTLSEYFQNDPPSDIHFKCGRCERNQKTQQAQLFSYTPTGQIKHQMIQGHFLEGRCFRCTRFFKGRVLEYGLGRRILWARFCQDTALKVMES
jgi:hypothetical protein